MAFHLLSSSSSSSSAITVMEAGVSQATDKRKAQWLCPPPLTPPLLGNGMMVSRVHAGVIVK